MVWLDQTSQSAKGLGSSSKQQKGRTFCPRLLVTAVAFGTITSVVLATILMQRTPVLSMWIECATATLLQVHLSIAKCSGVVGKLHQALRKAAMWRLWWRFSPSNCWDYATICQDIVRLVKENVRLGMTSPTKWNIGHGDMGENGRVQDYPNNQTYTLEVQSINIA